nr:diacylglycerol kinase 1-like [Tanacetum cinerariifolium]
MLEKILTMLFCDFLLEKIKLYNLMQASGCQRRVLIEIIGSYMGGVDLWHNKNQSTDNCDSQPKHDKRFKVVSIFGTWHMGKLQG